MDILLCVLVQAFLLTLALLTTALRSLVRLFIERQALNLSDYLIWNGWASTTAFVVCQCISLYTLIDHPLDEDFKSDSVLYLKTVFVSCYLFDIALFSTKASIIVFYWRLIPIGVTRMRIALYIGTACLAAAALAALLMDTLYTSPISDNWSIENQLRSLWNSFVTFCINWGMNISTDLLLFCLPFFLVKNLKLRKRQWYSVIGVFSLGAITMTISLCRFVAYCATNFDLDDATGAALCAAELCTALIVANLPRLKVLIMGSNCRNGFRNGGNKGYVRTRSNQPCRHDRKVSSGTEVSRSYDSAFDLGSVDLQSIVCVEASLPERSIEDLQIVVKRDVTVESVNV